MICLFSHQKDTYITGIDLRFPSRDVPRCDSRPSEGPNHAALAASGMFLKERLIKMPTIYYIILNHIIYCIVYYNNKCII